MYCTSPTFSFSIWGRLPRDTQSGVAKSKKYCKYENLTEKRVLHASHSNAKLTDHEVYRESLMHGDTYRPALDCISWVGQRNNKVFNLLDDFQSIVAFLLAMFAT